MEPFLNSYNLDHKEELDVVRGVFEELMERNHRNGIHQKPRLDVPLCNLRDVPHFVVLVLWLELQQELYNVKKE